MKKKYPLSDLLIDIAEEDIFEKTNKQAEEIEIFKVLLDEEKSKKYGKKQGLYYTITTSIFNEFLKERYNDLEKSLIDVLKECVKYYKSSKILSRVLVVGLGNIDVPSDSLGPIAIKKIDVTNHLIELKIIKKANRVTAVAPGVMGQTGLETTDIIRSISDSYKPTLILVFDALASKSINRLNATIQITTSGISPGSGILGNKKEISLETMKAPVIAIGIPLVVDYYNIINEIVENRNQKEKILKELPVDPNMLVSSKDILELVKVMTNIIAEAVNKLINPVI